MKDGIGRWTVTFLIAALLLAPASASFASKEKFVRSKPHVNISGPHAINNEILTVSVGLFDLSTLGGIKPATKPCAGEVDIFVEDYGSGNILSSVTEAAITPSGGAIVAFSTASATVRVRIVARDMDVDGVQCVLRGEMEFRSSSSGLTLQRIPIRRSDFVRTK